MEHGLIFLAPRAGFLVNYGAWFHFFSRHRAGRGRGFIFFRATARAAAVV